VIPWYYAAAIALGTFALGAGLGYRRGRIVGTLEGLAGVFGAITKPVSIGRKDRPS
jgi:hypothetical protein